MEGGIDFMRFDLYSYAWFYPFNILLLIFSIIIVFLKNLIKLFDIIDLFFIERSLLFDLLLQFLNSVESRSFVVRIEALNIEFKFIRNMHVFPLLIQRCKSSFEFSFFLGSYFLLSFYSGSYGSLKDLFFLFFIILELFLFGGFNKILRFIDKIQNFAVGRDSYNLYVSDFLEMKPEFCQIFPLSVVELQKLLLFDEFIIQFFKKLGLPCIFGLDMLDESPFELF